MELAALITFLTSPAGLTIAGLLLTLLSTVLHATGNRVPLFSRFVDWALSFVNKEAGHPALVGAQAILASKLPDDHKVTLLQTILAKAEADAHQSPVTNAPAK